MDRTVMDRTVPVCLCDCVMVPVPVCPCDCARVTVQGWSPSHTDSHIVTVPVGCSA